jgi:hypothetical protein
MVSTLRACSEVGTAPLRCGNVDVQPPQTVAYAFRDNRTGGAIRNVHRNPSRLPEDDMVRFKPEMNFQGRSARGCGTEQQN